MEPPTVTPETIEEATIYKKPSKKPKKKMARTKRTLPQVLANIFENQGFTDFI